MSAIVLSREDRFRVWDRGIVGTGIAIVDKHRPHGDKEALCEKEKEKLGNVAPPIKAKLERETKDRQMILRFQNRVLFGGLFLQVKLLFLESAAKRSSA